MTKLRKFDHEAWRKKHAAHPLRDWRVQGMKGEAPTKPLGDFDEIVVGHWLHVEMMSARGAWVRLGTKCYWLKLKRNGVVAVTHTEDRT